MNHIIKWNKRILPFVLAATVLLQAESIFAHTFIVGFGHHNSEPYTIIYEERLIGGIIKDIMDKAADIAGVRVRYMLTPRKKSEEHLLSGKVHAVAIANPAWFKKSSMIDWSVPIFTESDRFVVSVKNPFVIKNYDDLTGKKVGTVSDYIYPGLSELFNNGTIIRKDANKLEINFAKLENGKIDCLLGSEILINYYLKRYRVKKVFFFSEMIQDTHKVHIAFSKKSPVSYHAIDSALKKMKAEGIIDNILSHYK